jgi:hypothetical protein
MQFLGNPSVISLKMKTIHQNLTIFINEYEVNVYISFYVLGDFSVAQVRERLPLILIFLLAI